MSGRERRLARANPPPRPALAGIRATYAAPHAYAVGMRHVFVNGVQVLRDGEPTGATPGRAVHGPGWHRCH